MSDGEAFAQLLARVRACRVCAAHFAAAHRVHEPRPVLRALPSARLLIVGQAPGTRVHETGVPWNDASGDRLRQWLALDRETFYDESRIAIVPMGLCFPGTDAKGADRPPRPECAPLWHPPLRARLPELRLILLVGGYAQAFYLGARRKASMTETVAAWRDYLPDFLPTPHPSWRNTHWLKQNPWFETEVLPGLRARVRELL